MERYSRNIRLIGAAGQTRLRQSSVAVFGLGGVGSYVFEALLRAGVGRLMLVDGDVVEESNLNRQLLATLSVLGMSKAEAAAARARRINPDCVVEARHAFYNADNADTFDFSGYDFVCDAIDSVTSKILLIERASAAGVPVISAMGAGNKLGLCPFEIAPIEETSVCPLARVMRRELKKRGLTVLAVYSKEPPLTTLDGERAPGSLSFVPGQAGLVMAGEVIRRLLAIS